MVETNFDVACGIWICAKSYLLIIEPLVISFVATLGLAIAIKVRANLTKEQSQ